MSTNLIRLAEQSGLSKHPKRFTIKLTITVANKLNLSYCHQQTFCNWGCGGKEIVINYSNPTKPAWRTKMFSRMITQ